MRVGDRFAMHANQNGWVGSKVSPGPHIVRVEADGYQSQIVNVFVEKHKRIEVRLSQTALSTPHTS